MTWPSYKPEPELYNEAEVARLLTTAAQKAPDLFPLMAFAFFTGARKGEMAALTRGDVRFESSSIYLHRSFGPSARKSGKPVVVGIHDQLRAILEPLAKDDPKALVFPDPRTGGMRPEHDAKHGCWGIREIAKAAKAPGSRTRGMSSGRPMRPHWKRRAPPPATSCGRSRAELDRGGHAVRERLTKASGRARGGD